MQRPSDTPQLLDETTAAALIGISPLTLAHWRRGGRGPAHVRLGRLVRYRRSDVLEFIENNTVRNEEPLGRSK